MSKQVGGSGQEVFVGDIHGFLLRRVQAGIKDRFSFAAPGVRDGQRGPTPLWLFPGFAEPAGDVSSYALAFDAFVRENEIFSSYSSRPSGNSATT